MKKQMKRVYKRRKYETCLAGRKLLKWRKRLKITAQQAAGMFKVSESAVLMWELGYCKPRSESAYNVWSKARIDTLDWYRK